METYEILTPLALDLRANLVTKMLLDYEKRRLLATKAAVDYWVRYSRRELTIPVQVSNLLNAYVIEVRSLYLVSVLTQ